MTPRHRITIVVFIVLAFSVSSSAQFGQRMGGPTPVGKWTPVVGQGAAYSMEARGQKMEMQVAVVGTESHMGKTGHWLETVMNDPRAGGEVVLKVLIVSDGKENRRLRMIMQAPGQEAMEMSMEMMQMMGGQGRSSEADVTTQGTRVGTETITVPAGTFTCEHWKSKDGSDIWISEKAGPYAMVKMVSPDATMVLTKLLTDAKTRIKGTPKKMEMPG